MPELINTQNIEEKLILVGVESAKNDDTQDSLYELAELVKTAGARSLGFLIQKREKIHSATYIGKGKIEELREEIDRLGATGIVCDDELSPSQMRNLENILQIKVMDRTMVILDIFAKRASTKEGKIQVELAQLKYMAARLVGLRSSLSRLGGGIGTRGPGEKKIEVDRRIIHERISYLKAELREIEKHRENQRKSREASGKLLAAIVGYTNAGKSSLLNKLTKAEVLAEDKLFATLDPTTRRMKLPSNQEILLVDTVGFIRKLPHNLIEAFKSTLEEAKYADIILHVIDAADKEADKHIYVVYDTLKNLGIKDKEIITVFNKCDLLEEEFVFPKDLSADFTLKISVRSGLGLDELAGLFDKILRNKKVYLEKVFSYKEAAKIQEIRKYGELLSEEYKEEGISIKAFIPTSLYTKINL